MAETVLVTGGTGFIGGWCIRELLQRGHRVRTTVRSLSKEAAVRAAVGSSDQLTFFAADLTKDDGWDAAMVGCDYVLHVASPLGGKPPAVPRVGFWIVDVRDLADLHIRAMTAPEAAGQRFLAAGDFMWWDDIAKTLRENLGSRAAKVPTRRMPDFVVRVLALFLPPMRMVKPLLGFKNEMNTGKARRVLGFSPRSATATVVDCAESLLGGNTQR